MSRIGKTIREIPEGVTVEVQSGVLTVKGNNGQLQEKLHPCINIEVKDKEATVSIKDESDKAQVALWGTFSSILGNMIQGVTEGFKKQLEVNGVGYKVKMKGSDLELEVGYSHPVDFKAKEGIKFSVEKNLITVSGIDKQLVGQVAANIRAKKKPEPYKGKGIHYLGEVIRRKAGKKAAGTE